MKGCDYSGLNSKVYYQDDLVTLYCGDSREIAALFTGITAVVTDPPYELGFMGKSWDSKGVSFQKETWEAIKTACLPGAPLLAFGGSRTQHRIACAIEDAGWEIRDCLMWVYGQGFPKSMDISKAIDMSKGVQREVVGQHNYTMPKADNSMPEKSYGISGGKLANGTTAERVPALITAPTTLEAQLWNGWGTALKPAYEPIILAMNPVEKTFANNAIKHGVAGLNIDGCRVVGSVGDGHWTHKRDIGNGNIYSTGGKEDVDFGNTNPNVGGRFPANLLHDGSDEVAGLFPNSKTNRVEKPCLEPNIDGHRWGTMQSNRPARGYDEDGSAARFFYCAKASRSERDNGLDDMPEKQIWASQDKRESNSFDVFESDGRQKTLRRNNHPTVKPLALMEYLCKLVKMPERNLILDPFCGSGTTLLAARKLGCKVIGIELDEKSCEITKQRLLGGRIDDGVVRITTIEKGEGRQIKF